MINFCRNHLGMVKFLASCQVTDTSTKLENRFSSQTIGCKEGGKKF